MISFETLIIDIWKFNDILVILGIQNSAQRGTKNTHCSPHGSAICLTSRLRKMTCPWGLLSKFVFPISGPWGRRFKSSHPDKLLSETTCSAKIAEHVVFGSGEGKNPATKDHMTHPACWREKTKFAKNRNIFCKLRNTFSSIGDYTDEKSTHTQTSYPGVFTLDWRAPSRPAYDQRLQEHVQQVHAFCWTGCSVRFNYAAEYRSLSCQLYDQKTR